MRAIKNKAIGVFENSDISFLVKSSLSAPWVVNKSLISVIGIPLSIIINHCLMPNANTPMIRKEHPISNNVFGFVLMMRSLFSEIHIPIKKERDCWA